MQELPNGLYLIDKQEAEKAQEAALRGQRTMWKIHGDELVGVPEMEPCCNMIVGLMMPKIDLTPSPWWKRIYE